MRVARPPASPGSRVAVSPAGRGRLDQAGGPAGGVRLGGDLDEPQAAELAAAQPAAEIVLVARSGDLERDERTGQDVLPVFEPLPRGEVGRNRDVRHDLQACGRMRGWSRDVPGSARPAARPGPTMARHGEPAVLTSRSEAR